MELRRRLLSLLRSGTHSRTSMDPWERLEEEIAESLYCDELRRGAWVADIGVWGPAMCRREAARIVASRRAELDQKPLDLPLKTVLGDQSRE